MVVKNSRAHAGVYPGTFDPVTYGHLDIIERTLPIIDKLIVAVAVNKGKSPLFDVSERIDMIETEVARLAVNGKSIVVWPFEELLVNFASSVGANVIIRGLRAVSDFEYEFQMALMNRHIEPSLETVFMMPAEKYTYLSSRLIKEVFSLGGDVGGLVPSVVEARLRKKICLLKEK